MIVSVNRSGVLELFWRHRASTALSRLTSADFLSLRTRQVDIQYMRGWLVVQPGCESVRRLDDPRVIKRIASAVRSGEVVLAEPPAGPRLPGTGVAVSSVYGPMLLLPYRKLWHAADLSYALEWVPTLSEEELNSVRAVLSDNDDWWSRSIDQSSDIRSEIVQLLKTGELIPVFTYYPNHDYENVGEVPAVQPPDLKRSDEPQDRTEAATFGSDHFLAAQVGAMSSAAESGVPFCEVCNQPR
jgi:hypothetical protein